MTITETINCPICKSNLSRSIVMLENPVPNYPARIENYFDCDKCKLSFMDVKIAVAWIREKIRNRNDIPSCYWMEWMKV